MFLIFAVVRFTALNAINFRFRTYRFAARAARTARTDILKIKFLTYIF